jgi:hypothetical protein
MPVKTRRHEKTYEALSATTYLYQSLQQRVVVDNFQIVDQASTLDLLTQLKRCKGMNSLHRDRHIVHHDAAERTQIFKNLSNGWN